MAEGAGTGKLTAEGLVDVVGEGAVGTTEVEAVEAMVRREVT